MNTHNERRLRRIAIALLLAAGPAAWFGSSVAFAQEANPLDVLKSDAPREQKSEACRALSVKGGPDAIPVLAALLTNEEMSHMARYALEAMPYPEAGAALRDALGKTSGRLKVGVISSLGVRKDEQALPEITKCMSDADEDVAQAAIEFLAVMATPDAIKTLDDAVARPDVAPKQLLVLCDGLCRCAETLAASGKGGESLAIYERLMKLPNAPAPIQAAALRGAILGQKGDARLALLGDAVRGGDENKFNTALRVALELHEDNDVAAALASALPGLADERKVPLMDVMGTCPSAVAGPAVLKETAEGAVPVRVAALKALARMGYAPALERMAQLATSEDADLAKTARQCLAYFPSKDREADIKAMLASDKPEVRTVAVESIAGGAVDNPLDLLLKAAQSDADEGVRIAALKGLKDLAGMDQFAALLDNLAKARSQGELQATEKALGALADRQRRMPVAVEIQKAVYGSLPDGPQADVTDKVKALLKDGAVSVDASNANFGDTAPGVVKALRVDYVENGATVSKTAPEGQAIQVGTASTPPAIVDAYEAALAGAQGESKLALIRLLGSAGTAKALAIVQAAAEGEGDVKDTALRALCDWPTQEGLPALMELAKSSKDETVKVLALRGAVRLLGQNAASPETLANYATLLANAATADEKKTVIGGLGQVQNSESLGLVLTQFGDESVKAEAVQAAKAITRVIGRSPVEDTAFFSGKDLTGWQGPMEYWSFDDGAILGGSDKNIPHNEFLWSNVEVRDFYLAFDIKLEPNTGNGGLQFRSKTVDERGQALGYQADAGKDVWGRLYHEHGRGKLFWDGRAEEAVKPGEWNHYEVLAIGPAIWTAINGTLGVACLDPEGERSGRIAVQIHAGAPMKAHYKFLKLVHNPKVELAGLTAEQLYVELKSPDK